MEDSTSMADDPRKKKSGTNGGNTSEASNLPTEVIAEIRKQAVQQVAKTTILAAAGFLAIAGAGWLLYLKDKVPVWVNGVPKGAVAAFDLSDGCPEKWTSFDEAASRFIVGSGQGNGLKAQALRALGGAEEHKLSIEELPPHDIGIALAGTNSDRYDAGAKDYPVVTVAPGIVSVGGAGREFSLLPPFIALHYCKKS
jgi:hypothetical protein